MQKIEVGQIVRFSRIVEEFCNDMDVQSDAVNEIMLQTFIVLAVNDDELLVDVLSPDGSILSFGFHDLEIIENKV